MSDQDQDETVQNIGKEMTCVFSAPTARETYMRYIERADCKDLFIRWARQSCISVAPDNLLRSIPKTEIIITRKYVPAPDKDRMILDEIAALAISELEPSQVILVGRHPCCDVRLPNSDRSLSRITLIIFRFANYIIVIDPGSMMGFKTLRRTGSGPLAQSLPNARTALIIKDDENVVIGVGEYHCWEITINDKLCIVCMAKQRHIRAKCGHAVLCEDCFHHIEQHRGKPCPICRKPLVEETHGHELVTFMGSTNQGFHNSPFV